MRELVGRITRLEVGAAALVAAAMVVLVALEPDILQAPFENGRTVAFVGGGTAAAAAALALMLRFDVAAPIRVMALGIPFVAVSWWLISPFFSSQVVDDRFETSIAAEATAPSTTPSTASARGETDPQPAGPRLLGSGRFVGLAGHDGEGDAGFFASDDGRVLRLENFAIDNGPDLRLYVVAGADQTDPADGSLYLGQLRGNEGNQTYALPADFNLSPGPWTVLVWCEAFSVEFVAATVDVTTA